MVWLFACAKTDCCSGFLLLKQENQASPITEDTHRASQALSCHQIQSNCQESKQIKCSNTKQRKNKACSLGSKKQFVPQQPSMKRYCSMLHHNQHFPLCVIDQSISELINDTQCLHSRKSFGVFPQINCYFFFENTTLLRLTWIIEKLEEPGSSS